MNHLNSSPSGGLRKEKVSFCLVSVLGEDDFEVMARSFEEHVFVDPDDDFRIRREQCVRFCKWILAEADSEFYSDQLSYLMHVLSVKAVYIAKALSLTEGAISQYLSKERTKSISRDKATAICRLFLKEIESNGYILAVANNEESLIDEIPLGILKNKKWIEVNDGEVFSLSDLRSKVIEFFGGTFPSKSLYPAHYREMRNSSAKNIASDLCWLRRLEILAQQTAILPVKYSKKLLKKKLPQIVECSLSFQKINNVEAILAECGIKFFILKYIPNMKLQGVSLKSDYGPVIGCSLKRDYYDGFWFTLMHELGHLVYNHELRSGLDEQQEREANTFAAEQLLGDLLGAIDHIALESNYNERERRLKSLCVSSELIAIATGRVRYLAEDFKFGSSLIPKASIYLTGIVE